ncbi:hypothetical protein TNCV_816121 [Trichonephila clavipes]|nr:hypothetical protein TNCV_816121 [Trichonephila clavipes]
MEAAPADRRFYKEHGNWVENWTSNLSRHPTIRVQDKPAMAKMVGTRKYGKSKGCGCYQSNISTRESTYPSTNDGGLVSPLYRQIVACTVQP